VQLQPTNKSSTTDDTLTPSSVPLTYLTETEIHKRVPFGKWQIVDVTFPDTINTDCIIPHNLLPNKPSDVQYTILRQTTVGDIYEGTDVNAKAWTKDYIVLRSITSKWQGRLLLTLLKDFKTDFLPARNNSGTFPPLPDTGVTPGLYGNASTVPQITIDAQGRITLAVNDPIVISAATGLTGTLQAAQFPALTGDITTVAGALATTLATVNGNVGSFGSSTAIPSFTVNAKGLLTAASTNAVIAPAGTLTGTTLASNVVTSSLTSVGIGTGFVKASSGALSVVTNIVEGDFGFTDITTANATTSAHGLLRKLDNSATHFLDGQGNWSTPAGGGTGTVTHTGGALTLDQLVLGAGTDDIKVVAATDGQVPIGKSSDGTVVLATLTAGTNVSISNAAGAITIAATPGGAIAPTSFAFFFA
jgi:hypothetical protein